MKIGHSGQFYWHITYNIIVQHLDKKLYNYKYVFLPPDK